MAKKHIKKIIEGSGFECDKCGHEWIPRKGNTPKICPACKSTKWNYKKGGHHAN